MARAIYAPMSESEHANQMYKFANSYSGTAFGCQLVTRINNASHHFETLPLLHHFSKIPNVPHQHRISKMRARNQNSTESNPTPLHPAYCLPSCSPRVWAPPSRLSSRPRRCSSIGLVLRCFGDRCIESQTPRCHSGVTPVSLRCRSDVAPMSLRSDIRPVLLDRPVFASTTTMRTRLPLQMSL